MLKNWKTRHNSTSCNVLIIPKFIRLLISTYKKTTTVRHGFFIIIKKRVLTYRFTTRNV